MLTLETFITSTSPEGWSPSGHRQTSMVAFPRIRPREVAGRALTLRSIEWNPKPILEGKGKLRAAQVKAQGRGGADREPV